MIDLHCPVFIITTGPCVRLAGLSLELTLLKMTTRRNTMTDGGGKSRGEGGDQMEAPRTVEQKERYAKRARAHTQTRTPVPSDSVVWPVDHSGVRVRQSPLLSHCISIVRANRECVCVRLCVCLCQRAIVQSPALYAK